MRLPKENSKLFLPGDRCQRLFIQTWYSRVHASSLDTYRVRSLDSLAIADEILSSLGNTNVPLYRTKASCAEAAEILRRDYILREGWKEATDRVLAAITVAMSGKDKDTTCPDYLSLAYHLRRLKTAASGEYRGRVIQALETALTNADENAVQSLTGRLLTRLVNEGYSLEGLFGIVANVLIRREQPVDFSRAFGITKSKILAEDTRHQIIVRLTGVSKSLPERVGSIEFSQQPFDVVITTYEGDFYQTGGRTYFARITALAREERSAGEKARQEIERVLDALRFELINDPISVHDEFICIPLNKPAAMLRFPFTVPNPRANINQAEFVQFLERLVGLYIDARFSEETKSKMSSALRYYRLGLDTSLLQNRLVNSWTALEYLAKERTQESIIEGVRNNVIPLLVIPYLRNLLADFRNTLIFVRADMPLEIAAAFGVSYYRELTLEQLLQAIRGPYFPKMQAGYTEYPALQMALSLFREQNEDNKKTASYFRRHKQNIDWHLTRLYGARNDIVHSADTSTRLTLLCANLEYYVKLSLQEVLDVASTYQDINSLEEIFAVQRQAMNSLLSDLDKGRDEVLRASLIGAIC